MKIISSGSELRRFVDLRRAEGDRVGYVPTMGYLHDGHLSLIRLARQSHCIVVVSIFVNPAQFDEAEDLKNYPRDLDKDIRICRGEGVQALFVPAEDQLFQRPSSTFVEVSGVGEGLCDRHRPNHFRGVCTVLAKLFNIIGPNTAFFGSKDYQQLQIVRRMVRDLFLPVQISAGPTVRESDGLALSSRNARLSERERVLAPVLFEALSGIKKKLAKGPVRVGQANAWAADMIAARARKLGVELEIDYIAIRTRESLVEISDEEIICQDQSVMLIAARMGQIRLIDNLEI